MIGTVGRVTVLVVAAEATGAFPLRSIDTSFLDGKHERNSGIIRRRVDQSGLSVRGNAVTSSSTGHVVEMNGRTNEWKDNLIL